MLARCDAAIELVVNPAIDDPDKVSATLSWLLAMRRSLLETVASPDEQVN